MGDQPTKHRTRIEGTLEAYAETKDRGILWSIHEDRRPGPDGVHPLLNGDFLTVYGKKGAIIWHGIVDLDFELLRQPDPVDPAKKRQEVLGRCVHGLQSDEDPEVWAEMFFQRRRATLKRFQIPISPHYRS